MWATKLLLLAFLLIQEHNIPFAPRVDAFDNSPACSECTFWFSGQNCGTAPNDSLPGGGDGDCDNNDTAPIYTFNNGTYDYTADSTTTLSANNEPIIISSGASDPIATYTMTAENLTNGDYFIAENNAGSIQDGCEGRWALLYYHEADDAGEEYMGMNTVGGTRAYMGQDAATPGIFRVSIDYGATTFHALSTTNLVDDQWYMIEFAWCEGSCGSCSGVSNDTIAVIINGTEENTNTDTSFTQLSTGTGSNINCGRIGGGDFGPQEFAFFAIANDDTVDFWDRYAGRCTDGSTRCVDDAECGGGTCDNPAPNVEYPGAS